MEAIAIVGLAAQLPQDATSSEKFWELIREGRQTTSEIPEDRIHIDAFYHPDSGRSDTVTSLDLEIEMLLTGLEC
jgi:acyl transferase domain-containing protein